MTLWILLPFVILLTGIGLFFLSIVHSSKNSRVMLTEEHMQIKGGLYGRTIPVDELRIEEAKRINLKVDKSYALASRRNGIGLPDYNAGWFRLKNEERALAFVTDPERVVYIPTTNGYSLLLSAEDPDRLLRALGK